MGQGSAGSHQKENRSKQEAPSDPPGHGLLRGVMILPELDPIPAVKLLLACQLADFVIGRATLPAYHRLGVSTFPFCRVGIVFEHRFTCVETEEPGCQ